MTYTDLTGQPVTTTDTSRILALDADGTLATTVYALGLGDRLVGRDVSTGLPELANLPLVTHNGHELNGEAILDLRPTVVLTDYSIGPLEVQLQLRDSGLPVVIMSDQRSRAQIGPQIEAVATALGVPRQGQELAARVLRETEAARARVAELVPADPAKRLRMVCAGAEQTVTMPGRLGLPGREIVLDPMPEMSPANSLTFSVDVPDLWPTFRTAAEVSLRPVPIRPGEVFAAGTPEATRSASAWSMPWPQLVVLLLVVLAGLWVAWRVRARRQRREAPSQ
ncbi:ABC transporter substrate-binding protein [Actinoplanes sp. TRM 88003]|uniref:ABC transporter substrate-binding protein n=1 Tax=Paractinoplanes aksuensis TaxID=2939490 RepID=A0ABT1DL83_9ACTN|nr:ABC transporter substrate-binding protein [Actinoplanes aksuensis]MCO8271606.1 ABC transporter substrate-binding protein [Actinoplanes aksuensis]